LTASLRCLADSTASCLDAGSKPSNGGRAKVYTCYPGLSQQHWFLTGDNRIAITGGDQCLDRESGTGAIQTWRCTSRNTNQVFSTTETLSPMPETRCSEGKQEIAYPLDGANITALAAANGGKFRFRYCSAQYFRSSSRNIQVSTSCSPSKPLTLFSN
jgi:hypothetical protein